MNFLDESGIKKLWTKIKSNFGTAIFESSQDTVIPFVTNHQIVNVNRSGDINVYNWFQKASKGGILEIVFTESLVTYTYCVNNYGISQLYKTQVSSHGPSLTNIDVLKTAYDTYARLIKMDDDKLVVAEFVQNK